MQELSVPRLIAKRLIEDWQLLAGALIGMIAATTVAAIAPLYLDSLEQIAFKNAIARISGEGNLSVNVFASPMLLDAETVDAAEQSVAETFRAQAGEAYLGYETYIRGANSLVGLPARPLPQEGGTGEVVARGFVHHFSNLGRHAHFLSGRMAGAPPAGSDEPGALEAVISASTAERFDLGPGDRLELTPDLRIERRLRVTITGVIEPDDPSSDYWGFAGVLLDPAPLVEAPPEGIAVANPDEEEPPVALLVTRSAMVDVVGSVYPSSVVRPTWFSFIDGERLTQWSISEARGRFEELQTLIAEKVPESLVTARAVLSPIETIERRSFFTRVPLLLLLALMGVTILFYLATAVGYLARSRERDASVLRSRGAGLPRLARLYLLEGGAMVIAAIVAGPAIAAGAVSLAGWLPYFTEITGRGMLPIVLSFDPLILAAAAGLLCLAIFVAAGLLGAKGGVVLERLQSARPPALSFFHRYYLDVVVLVFGGIIFWELQSRGQLVSGGLFGDLEVNETLLLAPIAFLVVVALLFMRLFPMVVRFLAGESDALVHFASGASVAAIVGATLWVGWGELAAQHAVTISGALAFGLAYVVTHAARRLGVRAAALLVQAAAVLGMFTLAPAESGGFLYTAFAALAVVVAAQLLFVSLARLARAAPVWMSVAVWRMARSPTQYTWVVLLLVLATGLALLATTVGGTLERSQRERIFYDLASDVHVADVRASRRGGLSGLESDIEALPGVGSLTRAYRTNGSIGPLGFELLGIEPGEFARLAWYRPDFSDRPLTAVMGELIGPERLSPITLPDNAKTIGAWVRTEVYFRSLSIWAQIKDGSGALTGLSLGKVGEEQRWHLLSADIPDRLKGPIELVAIHLSEPGQGNLNTAGEIHIDDIHAAGESGEAVLLEGFEGPMTWLPIVGEPLLRDIAESVSDKSRSGSRSARYEFGRESVNNIRGIYRLPSAGAVPAVVSAPLADALGIEVGDVLNAQVTGLLVPVEVVEMIANFPTLGRGGFMLVDLDNVLGHLNVLGSSYAVNPNEFFISKADGPDPVEEISGLVRFTARVYDRDDRLEDVRADPLAGAGWKAMVLLSLAVVLLAATFSYASYLLLFNRRSRGEVGFLESMGLSRLQRNAMLAFEHLAVVAIGLGIGTWAGFLMSRMMVGYLAVTEDGAEVMPPFLLITDWMLMAPAYAAMAAIFLGLLFALSRSVGNLDLQAIARLGET